GHVDRVVARDVDAARPAELMPDVEQLAVLIEDLNAVVLAIADEQPPARVHRDRVRLADLSRARALRAPLLQILSGAIELHDTVVPAVAVAVGDEDGAVGRNENVGGLIEKIRAAAGYTGFAERHEHYAVGTELGDGVSLAAAAARVGDPEIAVAIDAGAVREVEHPRAPGLEQLAVLIELQNRRLGPIDTRVVRAAV